MTTERKGRDDGKDGKGQWRGRTRNTERKKNDDEDDKKGQHR